jgi:predicted nucleotidyltransferase
VQIPSRDDDYFWQGAIKNLDKELELYDLFQDAENMKIEETQQHVTIRWQPCHAL